MNSSVPSNNLKINNETARTHIFTVSIIKKYPYSETIKFMTWHYIYSPNAVLLQTKIITLQPRKGKKKQK